MCWPPMPKPSSVFCRSWRPPLCHEKPLFFQRQFSGFGAVILPELVHQVGAQTFHVQPVDLNPGPWRSLILASAFFSVLASVNCAAITGYNIRKPCAFSPLVKIDCPARCRLARNMRRFGAPLRPFALACPALPCSFSP